MSIKWMGAVLVVLGCGGFGFSMTMAYRRKEALLGQLIRALEYMRCELSYRLTPLPQLCRNAANAVTGPVNLLFSRLAAELDAQVSPDAGLCMDAALANFPGIPEDVAQQIRELGQTLGQFDLPGQLRGLELCTEAARSTLHQMQENRTNRLRSYQTLGLCAGAALAILLL